MGAAAEQGSQALQTSAQYRVLLECTQNHMRRLHIPVPFSLTFIATMGQRSAAYDVMVLQARCKHMHS
jgi:hypothetical protein